MRVLKEYKNIFLAGFAVVLFFAAAAFVVGNTESRNTFAYAEHIFQEGVVNEINIEINEADWQDMLDNPLEEEYHRANVTINGETIGNAAIRTKGNNTLMSVASSDSDRYSLKIDFDYYDENGNYYGLRKLCLNNNYGDSSSMREYISYRIMEDMGIPVPGCGYSHITVNGEEWGLYLAVEPIDEVFLATHFGDAAGDLYKPDGTGSDLVYRSEDISEYTGLNLKTNLETSDGREIIALMKALESGEGLTDTLDVELALKYIASNVALANFDSYLGGTTHNYYLYEQDGVFSVIPWDFNYAFGAFGGGKVDIYEPASNAMGGGGKRGEKPAEKMEEQPMEEAKERPDMGGMPDMKNMPEGMPSMGGSAEKPLVTTLLENETFLAMYEEYLNAFVTIYFTEEYMVETVTAIHDLIAPYVKQDATAFYTYEEFEKACSTDPADDHSLVYYAVNMADSIRNQLSGGEPSFDTGSLQGGGMHRGGEMPERGEMPAADAEMPQTEAAHATESQNTVRSSAFRMEKGGKGGRMEGMGGMPGERGQQQTGVQEVLPEMAVCGAVFAAGLFFAVFYKRKKDLK